MRQAAIISILLIILHPDVVSQNDKLFKEIFLEAEYLFMTEEYSQAIYLYQELLKTDTYNANLNFLVGACYLSMYGEKQKAIPFLEIAAEDMSASYREGSYKERSAPREALFALARAYHINEDFEQAITEYEKYRGIMFKQNFADVEYVNKQIKSCELAMNMVKKPLDLQYFRFSEDVNKFPSNYNPILSYDDSTLIYVTDRTLDKAIMMAKMKPDGGWTEPREINAEIGSDGFTYPTSLSMNGKELYLVKKNVYESDIYISYQKGDHWTKMIKLNNNINSGYFETHACISQNGKFLYFTSDRPGGQGALDLWLSETNGQGDWGEPLNLGPKVNSPYNEETPFLAGSGNKLFFSSQGHATMGGFDFFVAEKLPSGAEVNGEWSFPGNLGYPISTADDDLFYNPRKSGQGGYYACIIDSISPTLSIYAVHIKGEMQTQIVAISQDEEKRIAPSEPETKPETQIESPSHIPDLPPPGYTQPDEYYVLNSILFDFDSDALNDAAKLEAERILEVMRAEPEIKVELTGHADAVGDAAYNLLLSERRARSISSYLKSNGIAESRIKVTAAGESTPIAINKYEDGTDSPEGRHFNRQVSVKFENLQDDRIKVADIFVPDHLRPVAEKSYSVLLISSEVILDTIPDELMGEQTALIITDSAFLYTAGNFSKKTAALQYLNLVLDEGYPDAGMLEQKDLEQLIASLSIQGIEVNASYTIQIMALKKPVPIDHFKSLEGVLMYKGRDGFHRYVYGDFDGINEALDKLPSIKKMGYPDAFIMSILRYRKLAE